MGLWSVLGYLLSRRGSLILLFPALSLGQDHGRLLRGLHGDHLRGRTTVSAHVHAQVQTVVTCSATMLM